MSHTGSVITAGNVHDYFRDQVTTSLHNQHVELQAQTAEYLTNLLAGFTDPRRLFSVTAEGLDLKPLAFHYADAVHAEGSQQRNLALKRLGDVALFIAGIFSGSLNRSLVDVDYYIAMGGTGYRELHDALAQRFDLVPGSDPFGELAAKFALLVDVLAEIADESHLGSNNDVLRLYEVWLRTGSTHALRKLRRRGLQPSVAATSRAQH
jgi:hypothetical protein